MTLPAVRTLVVLAMLTVSLSAADRAISRDASSTAPDQFNEATVAQLQAQMAAGTLTSAQLTQYYIDRIFDLDQGGPGVNAIIELNPDALAEAREADSRRK